MSETRTFTVTEIADLGITDGMDCADVVDDRERRTVYAPGGFLQIRAAVFLAEDDRQPYRIEYLAGCNPDGSSLNATQALARTCATGYVINEEDSLTDADLAANFPGTVTLHAVERREETVTVWRQAGDDSATV